MCMIVCEIVLKFTFCFGTTGSKKFLLKTTTPFLNFQNKPFKLYQYTHTESHSLSKVLMFWISFETLKNVKFVALCSYFNRFLIIWTLSCLFQFLFCILFFVFFRFLLFLFLFLFAFEQETLTCEQVQKHKWMIDCNL